jgi:threonine dehydratase
MIGVEPEAGDDTKRSLLAGRRVIISGGNINTQRFTELCGR